MIRGRAALTLARELVLSHADAIRGTVRIHPSAVLGVERRTGCVHVGLGIVRVSGWWLTTDRRRVQFLGQHGAEALDSVRALAGLPLELPWGR